MISPGQSAFAHPTSLSETLTDHNHIIECQTCGVVLAHISAAEAQRVAANPYAFIFFCDECKEHEPENSLSEY